MKLLIFLWILSVIECLPITQINIHELHPSLVRPSVPLSFCKRSGFCHPSQWQFSKKWMEWQKKIQAFFKRLYERILEKMPRRKTSASDEQIKEPLIPKTPESPEIIPESSDPLIVPDAAPAVLENPSVGTVDDKTDPVPDIDPMPEKIVGIPDSSHAESEVAPPTVQNGQSESGKMSRSLSF